MKTRMFQHVLTLTCIGILWTGCQSTPFANRSDSRKALVEREPEKSEDSAIQKKLKQAMAEERSKARRHRLREQLNSGTSAEQLAALEGADQQAIIQTAAKVEAQALPLSDLQAAASQGMAPKADPTSLQRELNMAYEADRTGNLEKAQGYYQRVLAMEPEHFEALHRLAIIEDKKQNYPAAEAYYLKALKLDPSNADLLSDIGYSYMLQGRDDYGEKYLEEALKYQPRHARSLDHLGWYYGRIGRYDQAMAMFRQSSGEAQARQKFAQLFPGVNPGSAAGGQNQMMQSASQIPQYPGASQTPANSNSEIQPVGQLQPPAQQPVQYAAKGNTEQQALNAPASGTMNPTQRIVEMMQREREKAIQARQSAQQLPAINPKPAMNQLAGAGIPSALQQNSQLQDMPQQQYAQQQPVGTPQPVNQPAAQPGAAPVQIQAWPPANDPALNQAAEASQYWAEKEQQELQNRQQAQHSAAMTYRNQNYPQQNPQGYPQYQQQGQYQNMPAGNPQMQPAARQLAPTQGPRPGQPLYGNQYQTPPGQFPDYRSTQKSAPDSGQNSQGNDQQLMREVARTGMNMGPGQMFPVTDAASGQMRGNGSPLMSAQMGTRNIVPASAQAPFQNAYAAGGVRQAGYEYTGQVAGQGNVQHASMPQQFPTQQQALSSALPQSQMFSNNPVAAPANVRLQDAAGAGDISQAGYQNGQNGSPNLNQPPVSPFQWGSQPAANPTYQYSNQPRQY